MSRALCQAVGKVDQDLCSHFTDIHFLALTFSVSQ